MSRRQQRPRQRSHKPTRKTFGRPGIKLSIVSSLILTLGACSQLPTRNSVDTDSMLNASVSIKTISHVYTDRLGDSVWRPASGSGFLVDSRSCEIWTNHHVVEDAAIVEVIPRGASGIAGIQARVINSTPRSDIAVLHMENCDGIPTVKLGNSDKADPGDESYAVGNPLGNNPDSISRGIISHTKRYGIGPIPYLQTDAAINPGNSGGALFNRNGEVIGMNTAIARSNGVGNASIGYAIPINLVQKITKQLRNGPVSWGDAGLGNEVGNLSAQEAAIFKVPGNKNAIILTSAPTKAPANEVLQARDVIYRIGSEDVQNRAHATRLISAKDPGEEISLALIRAGQPITVSLTLADGRTDSTLRTPDSYRGHLGLTLETWDKDANKAGSFKNPVITKVHSLGPAHKARISSSQQGVTFKGPFAVPYQVDVKTVTGIVYEGNYQPVDNISLLEELATRAYKNDKPMLLEIAYWGRSKPKQLKTDLEHLDTAFFRVEPRPSSSDKADTVLASKK